MTSILNPRTGPLLEVITNNVLVHDYLGKIKEDNAELYGHSLRVGELSIELGFENGFSDPSIVNLGYAGVLHDVGKIHIPSRLLAKTERLTQEEKNIIYGHARLGFMALADFPSEEVRKIVVSHHEYKKAAYPREGADRRGGERREISRRNFEIDAWNNCQRTEERRTDLRRSVERRTGCSATVSELAQIVSAVDIFDALSHPRSYKPALSYQKVKHLLEEQYTGDSDYVAQLLKRW